MTYAIFKTYLMTYHFYKTEYPVLPSVLENFQGVVVLISWFNKACDDRRLKFLNSRNTWRTSKDTRVTPATKYPLLKLIYILFLYIKICRKGLILVLVTYYKDPSIN